MKQILFMAILGLASMSMSGCSKGEQNSANQNGDTKTLVAYFSATGITEGVAKDLAEVTGADLYKIEPEQPYTSADLDWRNEQSRSSVEMKDKTSRPAIKGKVEDMARYDTIYVGFPIWWYTCPTIINTFMESYDFKGKTVIPFATSGGSTIDKSCEDLKTAYPEANWKEGRLLNNAGKEDIKAWTSSVK